MAYGKLDLLKNRVKILQVGYVYFSGGLKIFKLDQTMTIARPTRLGHVWFIFFHI